MEDHWLKVRDIAEAVGMSSERVYHILTEELGMKKSARKCRSSWNWTINTLQWKCPSKVWPIFSATNKIFCASLWSQIKHGSTTIPQRQNSSQSSGNMLSHHHRRKQRQYGRRKCHGLSFLGCKRHSADRLSSHLLINCSSLLCKPPRATAGKDTQKKARFGKEKSSFIRTTPAHT